MASRNVLDDMKNKNLLPLPAIEPRFLGRTSHNLIFLLTDLPYSEIDRVLMSLRKADRISEFGIATGYGLNSQGIEFSHPTRTLLRAPSLKKEQSYTSAPLLGLRTSFHNILNYVYNIYTIYIYIYNISNFHNSKKGTWLYLLSVLRAISCFFYLSRLMEPNVLI